MDPTPHQASVPDPVYWDDGSDARPPSYSESSPTAPDLPVAPHKPTAPASQSFAPPALPSLPPLPPLPSLPLAQNSWRSKFSFRQRRLRWGNTDLQKVADAARARADAAMAAIDAVVDASIAAADPADDAERAAREMGWSITSVFAAVDSLPAMYFCPATIDMFLAAVHRVSVARANDMAAGLSEYRVLIAYNITTLAVFGQLSLDVQKNCESTQKPTFLTQGLLTCLSCFMKPLWRVKAESAPAVVAALNHAYFCVLRCITEMTPEEREDIGSLFLDHVKDVVDTRFRTPPATQDETPEQ